MKGLFRTGPVVVSQPERDGCVKEERTNLGHLSERIATRRQYFNYRDSVETYVAALNRAGFAGG